MKQNNTCTVSESRIPAFTRLFAPHIICLAYARFLLLVKKKRALGQFTQVRRRPLPLGQFIRISSAASSLQRQFTIAIYSQPVLSPKLVKPASCVWKEKITKFATAT